MTTATIATSRSGELKLVGQTVAVIGGSAGIGLQTAEHARTEGAEVVITGRDPHRLERAALAIGALRTAAFDAHDPASLERFFDSLSEHVDHVMVTASGPRYGPMLELDQDQIRETISARALLAIEVARNAAGKVRPGGTLVFMAGTRGGGVGPGLEDRLGVTVAMPALTASLALEIAPVRVNLIAAGFVDTGLSASLLGDRLDARRQELRASLPIGRVVGPADIAALAVHIMTNTAITGATFDIDGGQQLVE